MGTEIRAGADEEGRTIGDTLWAARLPDGSLLGLAWEWVAVATGIVALRDPNGIITNVRLEDESGESLPELRTVAVINGIAHATPWQRTVVRCLGVEWPPSRDVHAPGEAVGRPVGSSVLWADVLPSQRRGGSSRVAVPGRLRAAAVPMVLEQPHRRG